MINLYIMEKVGDLISAIMFVNFFDKVMPSKNKKYSKVYTIIMIIFYTSVSSHSANNIVPKLQNTDIFLFILSYYILVLIYPIFFKVGKMSEKFFLSSFYITMMLISSFIVYIIFAGLLNIRLSEITLYINYYSSIVMLINRFIQFVIIYIFFNNINFIKYIKDRTLYVSGVILILNHILILVIERDLLNNLNIISTDIIIIILSLCIIQILVVYMLNIFSKEMEEKFILRMDLNRKMHDEEIMDMYTEMSGWKHDFRNHISMISGLLQVSSKEDVISYINEIDTSIGKLDKNIYTDNVAINSILVSKMRAAKEKSINVSLDLKIDSDIMISNIDICIILGNLLDNSIEACSIIQGYKFIDLKIISKDNKLVIKIINNTNGYVNEVDGKFFTTKNNVMSGIGLTQVDKIIKKYNGYINRKHERNIFTTYMMI